jgi:hypothetical protein
MMYLSICGSTVLLLDLERFFSFLILGKQSQFNVRTIKTKKRRRKKWGSSERPSISGNIDSFFLTPPKCSVSHYTPTSSFSLFDYEEHTDI